MASSSTHAARYAARLTAGRLQGVGVGIAVASLTHIHAPDVSAVVLVAGAIAALTGMIMQDSLNGGERHV